MERPFETRDRKMSGTVRPLCALGLVLSLSTCFPLAALCADTPTEDSVTPVLRSAIPPTVDSGTPVLHSTITQTEHTDPQSPTVNTQDVRVVAPGTDLELVLSSEIAQGVSEKGDEFIGRINKDVLVDGRIVIPRGTVMHGVLCTMEEAKRAGRNGYITTRFDYLITPDGREIPIKGNSTTRDSKGKAAAKVVGRAAEYTAIGGVIGTLVVLQFGGLAAAVASHGSTVAGGAAVGGATGLTIAMLKKGKSVMLEPGAEMHVKLDEPLTLPTMTMPDERADDFSISGLKVKVLGMHRHPIGDVTEITLALDVLNQTDTTFSTFEIGVEDEMGNVFFPSPLGDAGTITPNTHFNNNITFSVDNGKFHHKLVFFRPFSREPLAKFALTDAMLASGKANHKQKDKRVVTEARRPN